VGDDDWRETSLGTKRFEVWVFRWEVPFQRTRRRGRDLFLKRHLEQA
jgi:hypothetical protein